MNLPLASVILATLIWPSLVDLAIISIYLPIKPPLSFLANSCHCNITPILTTGGDADWHTPNTYIAFPTRPVKCPLLPTPVFSPNETVMERMLLTITEYAASAAVDTPLLVIADAMALLPSATDFFKSAILLFISLTTK